MDRDRFQELSWTLLLWGLPGADQAEWEAEIERRGEAGRDELARLREALASMALAAPRVEPPARLREALLARVETEVGRPGAGGVATEAPPAGPAGSGRVVPWRRRSREWVAAALVAASIAALLAVWNVALRNDLSRAQAELARAMRDLQGAQGKLAAADSSRAQLESARRDLDALASPAATVQTLVGTPEEPNARARVFVDPETGRAILFVYDLPVLPPRTVYELWAIKKGTPVAAGTFEAGAERRSRIELEDPSILEGADVLAVTIEPAPGVAAPTGKMVLSSPSS